MENCKFDKARVEQAPVDAMKPATVETESSYYRRKDINGERGVRSLTQIK
jgi:hypothetical protein